MSPRTPSRFRTAIRRFLLVMTWIVSAPLLLQAQRIDGLRAGFAPKTPASRPDGPDECHMSRAYSAAIGAVSGGVVGYFFGFLFWAGSGGVLSSDEQTASRDRAKFMRTGAIIGAAGGAVWLAVHPVPSRRCPTDVTFRPSPEVDAGADTDRQRLGLSTT
jgi:hypothetical protein